MAKYVSTPNILWKIENFASVFNMSGPIIECLGLKIHMSVSQYMEAGTQKLQLFLECLSESGASKPWNFNIDACILHGSSRYLSQTGKYNSTHSLWSVWNDLVLTIYLNLGQVRDVSFLIMITPDGNFKELVNVDELIEETTQITPCTVSFSEDIGSLFNNAESSDFTLRCGDQSFFVHKTMLSARSHFFGGMFRHDMKEVNEKEGKIEKMEPDILELVLRYLYTGRLPPLPVDSLQKVYAAADRFIVEPLKIKCHSLFIDAFKSESEKGIKSEQAELYEPTQTTKKMINDDKERQMLKNLFVSREWRLFSEAFPHKAREMCKPYLLQELET